MPPTKRRKTTNNNKGGTNSRSNSRAPTPVPSSRSSSPVTTTTTPPNLNPPLVLTSEKSRGVYECDYCHSDISRLPRIRCAQCPDFDLCLECFLTTDHTSAIARLKASVDAKTAVDNLATREAHAPHLGKQANKPTIGGVPSTNPLSTSNNVTQAWHTGSGAIHHDDTHGYRVCDNTRYPLFPNPKSVRPTYGGLELQPAQDPIWTVEEDLRLLDGIETHGLGNWVDIAEAVSGLGSSGKTPKRCMERYFDEFLGRYGRILPPYTLVEDESASSEENKEDTEMSEAAPSSTGSTDGKDDPTRLSKRRHCINVRTSSSASAQPYHRFHKKLKAVATESLLDPNNEDEEDRSQIPTKDPPVELDQRVQREEAARMEKQFVQLIQSVPNCDAIRQEWEDTKYMKPGGPTVLPQRPEDVVKLPGAELAGFMPRRGDFDIEWENDAEQALADMEFLPGDLPADKKLKLQVLQIYNEKLDEREKRKNFILKRKLHDYRKNQEADAKLPRDERDLTRRMRLFERFHTVEEHQQFLEDILKAKRIRKEIAKLQMYRRMGITSLAEAERYELDKSRRSFHKLAVLQKEAAAKPGDKAAAAASASEASPAKDVDSELHKQYKTGGTRRRSSGSGRPSHDGMPLISDSSTVQEEAKPKAVEKKTDEDAMDSTASASDDFVLEEMEGFGYLSDKEADLCRKIQLSPTEYMEVKKVLIHESLKKGLLDKEGNKRTLVNIDVEKKGEIIDFMVQAAWLPNKGTMARTISE